MDITICAGPKTPLHFFANKFVDDGDGCLCPKKSLKQIGAPRFWSLFCLLVTQLLVGATHAIQQLQKPKIFNRFETLSKSKKAINLLIQKADTNNSLCCAFVQAKILQSSIVCKMAALNSYE